MGAASVGRRARRPRRRGAVAGKRERPRMRTGQPADPMQRHLYRVGHSWMVAVPKAVREHLRLRPRVAVYWHLAGPREAIISPHVHRIGGKPPGLDLVPQLKAAHQEIDRLRRKLQERPSRVFNQGSNAGVMIAQRVGYAFDETLREVRGDIRALRDELVRLARTPRPLRLPRGPRRHRPVEALTLPDAIPSPSPSPSSEVSGGDAASGGETPQAAHE
jgi:hypothetical protein